MKLKFTITFFLFSILSNYSFTQDAGDQMFDNSILHEIRFDFSQPDYWQTLINNFEFNFDPFTPKPYLMGTVTIDGTVVDSIGVRFKGFTSYTFDSDKKPFKIDFNEFVPGKRYDGLRKLNLNNATGDPGMQRDVVCYDMMRSIGVSAPRTAYATVFVNDEYWGLYQVIEQVDQEFLQNNFSNDEGNLFKNLSWSKFEWMGSAPSSYQDIFSLKTNEDINDWSGFINFIDFLNNTSHTEFANGIEDIFNVDLFLKTLAVDVATNNWDSYLEHGRNWYIYEDTQTGVFHWIPWDYNLSFPAANSGLGVGGGGGCDLFPDFVPLNDGTTSSQFYETGFSNGSPDYLWDFGDGNTSTEKEPLHVYDLAGTYEVCLTLTLGPDCSAATCKTINTNDNLYECNSIVNGSCPHPVGKSFALVTYYSPNCCDFWSPDCEDFYQNISNPGGGPSGFNFPIDQRNNTGVLISRLLIVPKFFDRYLSFFCDLMNLHYTSEKYDAFIDANANLIMDAVAQDPNALFSYNDFLFDVGENGIKSVIASRIEELQTDLATLTDCDFEVENVPFQDVVINELLASNDENSNISDAAGEYDDWIELYNNTNSNIDLSSAYLTDNPDDLQKWQFPLGTVIAPDEYLIIWADKDEDQPGLHANFKLSKEADVVMLTNEDGSIIDEVSFMEQETNIAYARIPNGTGNFVSQLSTFGFDNEIDPTTSTEDIFQNTSMKIYPNPATDQLMVEIDQKVSKNLQFSIIASTGQVLKTLNNPAERKQTINIENIPAGLYLLEIRHENGKLFTKKFMKE